MGIKISVTVYVYCEGTTSQDECEICESFSGTGISMIKLEDIAIGQFLEKGWIDRDGKWFCPVCKEIEVKPE